MRELVRQRKFNIKNNYIQAMVRGSKKLIVRVDVLKFENKKFIEALKI